MAGIIGACHHIFVVLVKMRFCRIGQAGLELLISSDPPASASQSAGITGVSHYAQFITLSAEGIILQGWKLRLREKKTPVQSHPAWSGSPQFDQLHPPQYQDLFRG